VYRSFQDVDAFRHEIERMRSRRRQPARQGQDQLPLLDATAAPKEEK
jgi:hypothetical protein